MKRVMPKVFAVLSVCVSAIVTPICKAGEVTSEEDLSDVVAATDVYDFTLRLQVPQVLNNTQSLGFRKYQSQTIRGVMYIKWLSGGGFKIDFSDLENSKFKIRGSRVRYIGYEDRAVVYSRYNYIGSNNTELFKTPAICFYLELEPNYAIGGNNEDNSFYVLLAGKGTSRFYKNLGSRIAKKFKGYAAGTQGCGCSAYSHKSPTRNATVCGPMDEVSDVVATFGQWSAKWKNRIVCSAIHCR